MTTKAASPSCCGKWRVVNSPNPATMHNGFTSVAAIAANDVWAVGSEGNQGAAQTLIEHWNGSTWRVVKSPNPSSTVNSLNGVAAVSNNVWAVGTFSTSHVSTYQTLIEHWNGSSWSMVSSPNQGSNSNVLFGITAISANDLWAVGQYVSSKALTSQTLIEHYNGSTWTLVASPTVSSQSFLHGVTALSAREVWAVGLSIDSAGVRKTLIEQWNGSTWRSVASPSPGSALNSLDSVTRVPQTGQIWAVGSYTTHGDKTLAELYG